MKASFEKDFNTLRELGESTFIVRGANIVVEILEPEEIKTAGGIVIAAPSDHIKGNSVAAHSVQIGKALMCGQGYWQDYDEEIKGEKDEAGRYVPLEVQPGAILILPQYSIQLLSHFPGIQRPTGNKLALVKMDQILAYYPSLEAYNLAKTKLNA